MMKIDFSGKAAIVTGGASGIGKAIALELADCGARIWLGDLDEKSAAAVCKTIENSGGKAGFTKTDVSNQGDIAALFADAKAAYGNIGIVVNSAGVFLPDSLLDATPERIKAHLDINLFGAIFSTKLALETMIAQGGGGKILNVASVGGRSGESGAPYYALGKSGVLNFTQSAALTGAPHGINVNAICPGIIRTPLWDVILESAADGDPDADKEELFLDFVKRRTPLGRAQTPEEMAYAACFLCSSYADAILGQALNVCGGDRMN
ncbi:MAG: SDR family oxidoreductase [Clostridiales bacterium]|nr:SDR family oxidoreductase [Clostridiales bacterium]